MNKSRLNSSRQVAVWEWTQAVLLAANLAWTTLCLGGYLAETMVLTSGLTATLLLVHAIGWAVVAGGSAGRTCDNVTAREPAVADDDAPARRWCSHPAGWALLPFALYALANVLWVTPVRWLGWIDWFGWIQLIAVFWVVLNGIRSSGPQRMLVGTLFALGAVAVMLACYQRFARPDWLMLGRIQADQYAGRSGGPFGIPNSLAAFLLLTLPVCGALAFRGRATAVERVFFGWLMLVLTLGVGLTISRGAWIGLAVALTVWPLVSLRASWRRRLAFAGAVLGGVLLIGAGAGAASPRVRERLTQLARDAGERSRPILWRAGWQILREHPVLGGGAGTFNVLFERHRPEGFLNEPHWAHNDYLNTLSDYGSVGFALFFGAAAAVAQRCVRARRRPAEAPPPRVRMAADWLDDRVVQQSFGIGLLAFALQLFVDFHFKIPALAMACATVTGLVVPRVWPLSPVAARTGRIHGGLPAVLVAGCGLAIAWTVVPQYRAEALRQDARRRIDLLWDTPLESPAYREQLIRSQTELDRAVVLAPENGQAWADRAYASAQWSRLEVMSTAALGREAEACADRAIKLGPVCAEFWIRRGVAREMQGRWIEAGEDFTHAITLSPRHVLPWYHYAYHLSLQPTQRAMAIAMVEFCLRLDPKNRDALRLRQRLATSQSGL